VLQVQTVGFLSHLRSKGVPGPFLVVGPLSTLSNWVSEVERWCPSMPVILYHGNKVERQHLRTSRMPTSACSVSPFASALLLGFGKMSGTACQSAG
jgi:SNF2 family DNA or RNA helicase